MNQFTTFEETEYEGTKFVTAKPTSSADEPVRFEATIADEGTDRDDPKANWEPLISTLASQHLGEALTIDGDRGVMSRDEAAQALSNSEFVHELTGSGDEYTAHALIEYLASEDVLQLEDDDVVVLMSYDEITDTGSVAMLNNWAATLDACVERIETAVSRVEQNKETLERHFEDLADSQERQVDHKQKVDEIEQEMAALLGGRMPSELSEQEERRFTRLRRRYHRYETLVESSGSSITTTDPTEELAFIVEDLKALKGELQDQSSEFRVAALTERLSHSGAKQLLENLTGTVAQLSQATAPTDKMEEMSNDEFAKQLATYSESTEQTTERDHEQSTRDSATERTLDVE